MKACAAGYALNYVTTRMPDSRQGYVSCISYAWLLLVQYHVHLD
jgi:hypothetical protein